MWELTFEHNKMTYIITAKTEESILMASDTRMNYFHDIFIKGKKCQKISAIADCIQKTFYIKKAKVGIQFSGIGYFEDNEEEYPLSHFIDKLERLDYEDEFHKNAGCLFQYFAGLSKLSDTGQYVIGVIAGFAKQKALVCCFNTFNNDFRIQEMLPGQFVDSENNKSALPATRNETILEIIRRINDKSSAKWWYIGGPIDILEMKNQKEFEYIQQANVNYSGTKTELRELLKNDPGKINGRIIDPPYMAEYNI